MRLMRPTKQACCALFLTVAALSTAAACAKSPAPSSAAGASANEIAATLPAGLAFHAHLDRALSSDDVRVGEPFTATLDEPLRSSDGTVRVPSGAKLTGRVIGVDRGPVGRLSLQFESLYVGGGAQPIGVHVVDIEHVRVAGADATSTSDASSSVAFVYPLQPTELPAPAEPVGGGPPPAAIPVEIARNAQLQLSLSRAFTPPAPPAPKQVEPDEHPEPRIEGF